MLITDSIDEAIAHIERYAVRAVRAHQGRAAVAVADARRTRARELALRTDRLTESAPSERAQRATGLLTAAIAAAVTADRTKPQHMSTTVMRSEYCVSVA